MVIVISIHQVADKSVFWKQAAQATKFGAIWLQLIGQEVWQKLSYFFDQLLNPLKSLRNPSDLVCSRNYYILWYKFQKFKKWEKFRVCIELLYYENQIRACVKVLPSVGIHGQKICLLCIFKIFVTVFNLVYWPSQFPHFAPRGQQMHRKYKYQVIYDYQKTTT